MVNKQSRTANKGWSSTLGEGRRANNPSYWKHRHITNCSKPPRIRTNPFERRKHRKIDLRFGTSNVESLYGLGWHQAVAREFAKWKYKRSGGAMKALNMRFFLWERKWRTSNMDRSFVNQRIASAFKRPEQKFLIFLCYRPPWKSGETYESVLRKMYLNT